VRIGTSGRAREASERVYVCAAALCAPSHRTASTCGINSSARAARCGRACVVAVGATGRVSRVSAAGITWTSRTLAAEWDPRFGSTSVVDAAGAIYVIGGSSTRGAYYRDVWASTNGGARPDSVQGDVRRVLELVLGGVPKGYYGLA
jgi:hypothetical protein